MISISIWFMCRYLYAFNIIRNCIPALLELLSLYVLSAFFVCSSSCWSSLIFSYFVQTTLDHLSLLSYTLYCYCYFTFRFWLCCSDFSIYCCGCYCCCCLRCLVSWYAQALIGWSWILCWCCIWSCRWINHMHSGIACFSELLIMFVFWT